MKNEIEIMAKIMYEDNKLTTKINRIIKAGVNIDELDSSGLFNIIMDILEGHADYRDGAFSEYFDFMDQPRDYMECYAFSARWHEIGEKLLVEAKGKVSRFTAEGDKA